MLSRGKRYLIDLIDFSHIGAKEEEMTASEHHTNAVCTCLIGLNSIVISLNSRGVSIYTTWSTFDTDYTTIIVINNSLFPKVPIFLYDQTTINEKLIFIISKLTSKCVSIEGATCFFFFKYVDHFINRMIERYLLTKQKSLSLSHLSKCC